MTSGPNMPPLSEEARRTLDAFRAASPGAGRRQANRGAVRRRIEEEARAPAAAAAALAWPLGWGLVSAAAAAGLIWGIVAIRSPAVTTQVSPAVEAASTAAPPSQEQAPQTAVSSPPPRQAMPVAAPPASVPVTKRMMEPVAPAAAPTASALVEETRMLREVRGAIASGELDRAAKALDLYTAKFPDGALREDAQAYRVVVKCEQGLDGSALRRAFERRYPVSPHVARIEAACSEPSSEKQ